MEDKRRRRDVEKPWLDDVGFKELVEEKGRLYSRKIKGLLGEEGGLRLVEVSREVNRMRRRLKSLKRYMVIGTHCPIFCLLLLRAFDGLEPGPRGWSQGRGAGARA